MSQAAVLEGKKLLNHLGIDPVYTVSLNDPFSYINDAMRKYIYAHFEEGTRAFTSPILDAQLRTISLKYEWRGRGHCVVLSAPPACRRDADVIGTMLHEAGHYLQFSGMTCRDDPDTDRARHAKWDAAFPASEHHNSRWVRATIHLWHRACEAGVVVPMASAMDPDRYSVPREQVRAVLAEAKDRESENIEAILGTTQIQQPGSHIAAAPSAALGEWRSQNLFASRFGGKCYSSKQEWTGSQWQLVWRIDNRAVSESEFVSEITAAGGLLSYRAHHTRDPQERQRLRREEFVGAA